MYPQAHLKVKDVKGYAQRQGVKVGDILRLHGKDCVVTGLFDWFVRLNYYSEPGLFTGQRIWLNTTIHQFDLYKSGAVKRRKV